MAEKNKTAIDAAFDEVAQVFGENRVLRREQIQNLREAANNPAMKISEFDKPMLIQSKLMIIKTLDDLLKSDEDVSVKRLKMQLSKKDSETNGMVGQTIVSLLKSIRATGDQPDGSNTQVDHGEVMAELLEKQKDNKDLSVSAGELEQCGDAPTTDGSEPPRKEEKKEDEEE